MIQIEDKIVSSMLFQTRFVCDLKSCLGACCIYGDSGAPLEKDEAEYLTHQVNKIAEYISCEGITTIRKHGAWLNDADGDLVTPLINGKECAYTVFENGVAKCGIELAYDEGAIQLQKPLSCHLYPVRVKKIGEFTALNFHHWHICEPALVSGRKLDVPVFRFLKAAIVRAWGNNFYNEMEKVFNELHDSEKQIKIWK